ncbi:glycoside hydrolase family 2 protein [Phaeacidiphilus oryzae]|uniref:glycoside hydrolase family 2 protein n=1 Tax=Phaeacidiphilus oryzae TaxID=348818 RepID=UPI001377FCE9|nr:glycoside hydrolase family 2 TIM barrel-domain containing protein [Phaeacidiphilus oryzae]
MPSPGADGPTRPAGPSRRSVLVGAAAAAAAGPLLTPAQALAAAPAAERAATPAPAADTPLAFVSPAAGARLDGLADIEVRAPAGTTAVRFSLDGIAFSELTDLYSRGSGLPPVWRTATDAGWFPAGRHTLTAEADTPAGIRTVSLPISTVRPAAPAGRTVLDGGWLFATAGELPAGALEGDRPPAVQPGYDTAALATVLVPSAYGAVRDAWNVDDGQAVLHRRQVALAPARPGERTVLTLESAYYTATVYVNGSRIGAATGGYLPQHFDVTEAVTAGDNTVAVVTDNRSAEVFSVNWKLFWNWGGLLAGVHLDRLPGPAVLTGITAEGSADGTLVLRGTGVNTTGTAQTLPVEITVTGPEGRRPTALTGVRHSLTLGPDGVDAETGPLGLRLPGARLWEPDDPALYEVSVRQDGWPAAELTATCGFRDIRVDGARLLLNGRPLTGLQGFNRHTDYPGLGRAQPDGLAERELARLKAKGFSIFRPAHYPTTPGELAAADRLGLLVVEEIDVTQRYTVSQLTSPQMIAFAEDRLTRMIRRDRGHPSVIGWSVGNENGTETTTGAGYVQQLIGHGKTLDATRPFTHVTGWGADDEGFGYDDFLSVNVYDGWYYGTFDTLTDPAGGSYSMDVIRAKAGEKPIFLTEYGADCVLDYPGTESGTEFFQGLMIDEYNRRLEGYPQLVGKWYWTSTEFMLTPAGSSGMPRNVPGFHNKGLQTYWRQPKLGWRVIFSPVRIDQLPASYPVAADGSVDRSVTVTLREVRGRSVRGTLVVTGPEGTAATPARRSFRLAPGGSWTTTVRVTGRPVAGAPAGYVRAIVDEETEAQPRLLQFA